MLQCVLLLLYLHQHWENECHPTLIELCYLITVVHAKKHKLDINTSISLSNNFQLYNEKYTQEGWPSFRINTNFIQKVTPYRILHRSMESIPTLSTWIANSWIWEEFFAQLPTMEGPWSMGPKGIALEGTPCDSNGSCLDDATNAYV